jgi:hypothetical protein
MTAHDELIAQRLARLDEAHQHPIRRNRRIGLAIGSAALATIMALAVLDGADLWDTVGVDDGRVTASAEGTTLEVRYPTLARPALAAPFEIVVTRSGGFDGQQVEVAVSSAYFTIWDLNGIFPQPAEETADGGRVLWTFDPPDGDVLRIVYEARIEPARQDGEAGRVAVLDENGRELVAADFETRVRP